MLLIRQKSGPYAGKFDFPGGGIEFGETPEQALRREFREEVAMEFESYVLVDNMTVTVDVPKNGEYDPYLFYQIGMIYEVSGLHRLEGESQGEFELLWIDPSSLKETECSPFLWQYKTTSS
jgi:8-oxo-dGTP pyrophosphatase MutT (NUDIX family)